MPKAAQTHTKDLFDDEPRGALRAKARAARRARNAERVPAQRAGAEAPVAPVGVGLGLRDERFLTDPQVADRYGVTRATVWRWASAYPSFPKPHPITPGTTRWYLSELLAHEAVARNTARHGK
jgi:predicted DNA-binding transcriptional regulator AlpA